MRPDSTTGFLRRLAFLVPLLAFSACGGGSGSDPGATTDLGGGLSLSPSGEVLSARPLPPLLPEEASP